MKLRIAYHMLGSELVISDFAQNMKSNVESSMYLQLEVEVGWVEVGLGVCYVYMGL